MRVLLAFDSDEEVEIKLSLQEDVAENNMETMNVNDYIYNEIVGPVMMLRHSLRNRNLPVPMMADLCQALLALERSQLMNIINNARELGLSKFQENIEIMKEELVITEENY